MGKTDTTHEKLELLKTNLRDLRSVAVAFSAGVDSTFLLKTAYDVLCENAVAVTVKMRSFSKRELNESVLFCEKNGIKQAIVNVDEFEIEGFRQNPPNRCYICKRTLMREIIGAAEKNGIRNVVEGSNADDVGDYRPGMKAVAELGILSPLREVKLTKSEIRVLSREAGLDTWNRPSCACLSTRIAYGEEITEEKLLMAERAEEKLLLLGFRQVRVRIHGKLARIEVDKSEIGNFLSPETRGRVADYFRELGFLYVTLDLNGYRAGSMNAEIKGRSG